MSRDRFLSSSRRVFLVKGWSRLRGSHVIELNRAFQSTLGILAKVQPGDLDAPTPCASWDVRALVNHFVGTARWWAVTIAGEGETTDADYAVADFVAAYEESIQMATVAFDADGALEKTVRLARPVRCERARPATKPGVRPRQASFRF
jgi:uncharacterized protein (TIGR03086 family)